ncbi:MAG: hypothetical protein LOD92_04025, partial [Bacillales bacterium]
MKNILRKQNAHFVNNVRAEKKSKGRIPDEILPFLKGLLHFSIIRFKGELLQLNIPYDGIFMLGSR